MNSDIKTYLEKINLPEKNSHKGQNGKLLVIGGSHLFHAASLWALKIASRIADLVHYSSIEENNKIVQKLKLEFQDGIVVPRGDVESYIEEDDCVLIGPGMVRSEGSEISNIQYPISKMKDIEKIEEEGVQTYYLTKYLLQKYPDKKWVIDAGALQMLELEWIPNGAILTPHHGEFERLKFKAQSSHLRQGFHLRPSGFGGQVGGQAKFKTTTQSLKLKEQVIKFAEEYHCTVLLKGEKDLVASENNYEEIKGGNGGMTKGGTGDVLAGLTAALYAKNDAFTAAVSASYINKKAGSELFRKMGYWFNASDLADQIPQTMRQFLIK